MSLLIIHLSDLHANDDSNAIEKKWELVCRIAVKEITTETTACAIVFNGDAANHGGKKEFEVVSSLLNRLHACLSKKVDVVHILCVPGNHDCDLTSEDQEARTALREKLAVDSRPSPSVEKVMLSVQSSYFEFAKLLPRPSFSPTSDSPYYVYHDMEVDGHRIRFHLLNSSWSSVRKEREDLHFPLTEFTCPGDPEADFAITVVHHPSHWFYMPGVRRELQSRIDDVSDLVLTGHEHAQENSRRTYPNGLAIEHLEGGSLQDHDDLKMCTFNVLHLDFKNDSRIITQYQWQQDRFESTEYPEQAGGLCANPLRGDRKCVWRPKFEDTLDELQDPLIHPRKRDIRLSHIFVYPDLRKIKDIAGGKRKSKSNQVIDRIKGDDALEELLGEPKVLITGGEKFGKTSLARQMVLQFRTTGRIPLLLDGKDLGRQWSEKSIKKKIEKAIQDQYRNLSAASYHQLSDNQRAIVIDDFDQGPSDPASRAAVVDYLSDRFDTVLLLASDELNYELIGQHGKDSSSLLSYQRYEICEFLHLRLEELAAKWVAIGSPYGDLQEARSNVAELCTGVESMLAVAGLPHTPYLLTALMAELDEAGVDAPDIALQNGNYGPLYEAMITKFLVQSNLDQFDLTGKKTYLSELAFKLYSLDTPSLSLADAREFHAEYCSRYTPQDFDRVIADLCSCRMIRLDGDQISFRHKYVFSYFTARWLSRNIRKPDRKSEVEKSIQDLGDSLHHDLSANILVFLAHASEDPDIFQMIRTAASKQFEGVREACLGSEIDRLNELDIADSLFVLPPSPPEINRKLIQDAEDERRVIAEQRITDGRKVKPRPDLDDDISHDEKATNYRKQVRQVRAALRTIRILGQVARNGASSLEREELRVMMLEIINLGRRLLGWVFEDLTHLGKHIHYMKHRCYAYLIKAEREKSENKISLLRRKALAKEASFIAVHYVFNLHWVATLCIVRRLAHSIGLKNLDPILNEIRRNRSTGSEVAGLFGETESQEAEDVFLKILSLQIRINRPSVIIPADELVEMHSSLKRSGNKLAQVITEAIAYERLLVHKTDESQKQKICKQLDIKTPVSAFDPTRKKFSG